ncbi:MAG: 4-hydroxybutyrate CoA-transferase [Bacteroidales bacterium]|nr:4-hydroxybutyrate CoA-transferase [Bacteroidales bacterium]
MTDIRFVTADEAVSHIPSHCHIHLSSVASVPHCLIQALCRRADAGDITDLHFHHFHTEGPAPYSDPAYEGIFFEQGFFVGPNVRKNVNAGYADYLPVHLGETPKLYREGYVKLGAALVNVSLPDENGMVSLGTSVDCSVAAIDSAELVIGVVNPNVPFAYGDLIPLSKFDYLVQDDAPLVTAGFAEPTEVEKLIGKNCAALVEDGDCLQMGIGALPNALTGELQHHKNLGLHTEMFADGLLRLIKAGVINNACKKIDTGKVVSSFLLGSQEVYSFIDHNPDVLMRDIAYTNNPFIIAQNPHMKAINSAVEVDLTGQICADSIGTRLFSGTGGQVEFVRGATMSEGGKSITAFASRSAKGFSKIVPVLKEGAGVVTPRSDAHWVVTEYGAVDLYGRSCQERAKQLISIAHPEDRENLDRAAFERFGPHWHNFSI